MSDETGVFVLGMHRSGTSMTAQLISLLGIPLSLSHDVMSRPVPDNPKDYWESAALTSFNERLLRRLGGDTWNPPALEEGWEHAVDPDVRVGAVETFRSVYSTKQWMWKDPRNCLALPFWVDVLEAEAICVAVYRNPLEVAASLAARDGLTKPTGLAFWELYNRALLRNLSRRPVLITSYEDILDDRGLFMRSAAKFLRSHGVDVREVPTRMLDEVVDPDLRSTRSASSELDLDGTVSPSHKDLYVALESIRGVHDAFDPPTLPEPTDWIRHLVEQHASYMGVRRTYRRRMQELRRALREQELRSANLESRLALIAGSRSFRYTAPIRRFGAGLRRAVLLGRRKM